MKTLELRIERQNSSAMKISGFLKRHPKVSDVFYPGLPTHPGHKIAREIRYSVGIENVDDLIAYPW